MNTRTMIGRALSVLAIAAAPALGQPAAEDGTQRYNPEFKVDLAWNRYYDLEQVEDAMRRIAEAHPQYVELRSIGKSIQGRDIWIVIVNNPETGAHDEKPAMYIDGSIHANEIQATEVVLYSLWYLVEKQGINERLTELLNNYSFYFVPVVSPDGRAYWFEKANSPNSSRHNQRSIDNDRDGLFDEDPYDDLDGDGSITQMWRQRDGGGFRRNPDDPRRFERVGPGERSDWEYLGGEGLDNDGDGRINEDGPFGDDMNRNWPGDWQPTYVQFGAGPYPLSSPETRAVGEFVLAHPNIAGAQSYHNTGGMILRGPGVAYRESLYPSADDRVYDRIAQVGAQQLPYYRDWVIYKDLYGVHGGEVTWFAESLGVISFTNELWRNTKRYQGEAQAETEDQRWLWRDHMVFGDEFSEYTEVEHPEYGTVLVGGTNRWGSRSTPPFLLEEEAHRNFAFTMFHARHMPLLRFGRVEMDRIAPDTYRVDVAVRNERVIPTRTANAQRNRIGANDLLLFESDDATLAAAGRLSNWRDRQMDEVRFEPERIQVASGVPGEGEVIYRFIVEGEANDAFTLTYQADKARTISKTFRLGTKTEAGPEPLAP
ncbi:MAG: M14 family metallopeptidase [Planctomycetota bacterium]